MSLENQDSLVKKFQELKLKHSQLLSEKGKYEAKRDQLASEIKSIQEKYSNYDLSTVESVELILKDLNNKLSIELSSIEEQFNNLKTLQ